MIPDGAAAPHLIANEAALARSYPTKNPFMWFFARAVATYLEERAAIAAKEQQ